MNLSDLFDRDLFDQMVFDGFIRVKAHPTEDLAIANYAEKTAYEKNWNHATLQCRGLIYSPETGEIVARPFPKFFNVGEYGPEFVWPNESVVVTDKMDGSLGILYQLPSDGSYAIATRGSFASDQAIKATEILHAKHAHDFWPQDGFSYMFEILFPSNRIVLDYGDKEDVVLLAAIGNETGNVYSPLSVLEWQGESTKVFDAMSLAEALAIPPRPNAEGVVIRFESGLMVKCKQEDYVRAHAVVTGCTNRSIWETLSKGESLPEKASFMPDEFHAWMIKTAQEIKGEAWRWRECAMSEFRKLFRTVDQDRKQFAALASQSEFRAALFKLYDGQSIDELAWKAVRPVEIVRPFAQREDSN